MKRLLPATCSSSKSLIFQLAFCPEVVSCQAPVFSRKTLAEVATEFGFADQSYFTKEFAAFRAKLRTPTEDDSRNKGFCGADSAVILHQRLPPFS
jgi:hypothetical protein